MNLKTKRERRAGVRHILKSVPSFDEMMKVSELVERMALDKSVEPVRTLVVGKNGKEKWEKIL